MELQILDLQTSWKHLLPIFFLYVGPETMLPVLSALTAIAGVLLMFWQRFVGLVQKLWRLIVRK